MIFPTHIMAPLSQPHPAQIPVLLNQFPSLPAVLDHELFTEAAKPHTRVYNIAARAWIEAHTNLFPLLDLV